MFDKVLVKSNLQKSVAKVTFMKADGSIREMNCTLKPDLLPEVKLVESHVPRKQSDEILAVWDLDNNGWRSFRLDSVTNIAYIGVDYATSK